MLICFSINGALAQENTTNSQDNLLANPKASIENPATHFSLGAALVAIAGFVIPFRNRRKNITMRGMATLARTMDGVRFRGASKKLRSHYFEGEKIEQDDLDKAAEQIAINLTIVQGLIEAKYIPKKRASGLYADIIVRTIDAYQKYLQDTQPQYPVISPPMRRLYANSQEVLGRGNLYKAVKE